MSEKIKEVLIEREGKTWRWGQDKYLRMWNGAKFTINTAALKTLMLPVALALAVISYCVGSNEPNDGRGKEFATPSNITRDLPLIDSKILSERDLIRNIEMKNIERGKLAQSTSRIQVFSLRTSKEIPVGTEVRASLESGATNGIVKAKLLFPMLVDGEPVLPERTIVFGRGRSTDERLFIEFRKAILPTGESYPITAQAFDQADKILGLKGSLVGSRTKKMAMGLGFGFLGGMADGLQDTSGSFYAMERKKSLKDAALAGTSKAALDQSQLYMEALKNSPNIIEVKKGTEFFLIIDEPKQRQED